MEIVSYLILKKKQERGGQNWKEVRTCVGHVHTEGQRASGFHEFVEIGRPGSLEGGVAQPMAEFPQGLTIK